MADFAPGARCTAGELPPFTRQVPIYNHYDPSFKGRNEVVAFFLLDKQHFGSIVSQPPSGRWRLEKRGKCIFAAWYEPSPHGQPGKVHYMNEEVWKLSGQDIPAGHYIGFNNDDPYDLRVSNLRLRRTPVCKTTMVDHSSDRIPRHTMPGLRLIDHSFDKVRARLDSTLHRHSQIP